MCFLVMLGIAGIYARQSARAGWLVLVGFLVLTAAFQFAEALTLPLLTSEAVGFVEGFVGTNSGATSGTNLGVLPTIYSITSVCYLLGGMVLVTATFRAGVLPRWTGAALAIGTVFPLVFVLLPHEFVRLAAVPFGLPLAWLGYVLWSERRAPASQAAPAKGGAQLRRRRLNGRRPRTRSWRR